MTRDRDHDPGEDMRSRRDWNPESRHEAVDALLRDLDLPHGASREAIEGFRLRGSESRILAAAGVFRVVPQEDLELADPAGRSFRKDVEHLRELRLLTSQPFVLGRDRCHLLTLTERGRALLESRSHQVEESPRQSYYSGVARPRELGHDSRLFSAYRDAADRLLAKDCHVVRVRLDNELKRDYQIFLQEPNRRSGSSSGRPQRDSAEIARWAREHHLPTADDSVQFPDFRIEYERPDGERGIEDVEVITPNYRGAHRSGKSAAGFSCYRYGSARIGGARTSNRGGRARDSRLAEELLL